MPSPDDPSSTTIDKPFGSARSERYLVYALSTITARSLPDVRDGLKPVYRCLLWAMRRLRLDPADAYKKSARVVGDVWQRRPDCSVACAAPLRWLSACLRDFA